MNLKDARQILKDRVSMYGTWFFCLTRKVSDVKVCIFICIKICKTYVYIRKNISKSNNIL